MRYKNIQCFLIFINTYINIYKLSPMRKSTFFISFVVQNLSSLSDLFYPFIFLYLLFLHFDNLSRFYYLHLCMFNISILFLFLAISFCLNVYKVFSLNTNKICYQKIIKCLLISIH